MSDFPSSHWSNLLKASTIARHSFLSAHSAVQWGLSFWSCRPQVVNRIRQGCYYCGVCLVVGEPLLGCSLRTFEIKAGKHLKIH